MPSNHKSNHDRPTQPLSGATRSFSLLLCLGALAGVLIWAKLRLVTDIPRSAYADPKERFVENSESLPQEEAQPSSALVSDESTKSDEPELDSDQDFDESVSRPQSNP